VSYINVQTNRVYGSPFYLHSDRWALHPPIVAAIVVNIVVINDGGGGVGADDRHPLPHTAKGWPADNVATVIVRFPPVVCSLPNPFPSSLSSYSLSPSHLLLLRLSGNRHSSSYFPPLPPPPPIPSSSAIEPQHESKRKTQHVQPLVHAQDANCKVSCIVARRWSRSNNRLPQHFPSCLLLF
jgi:hypothetical protein